MPSPFDDIFGGSGPQWTRDQIIARIRGEADAQKVDPDLAVAVATQESYLNPNARGDNGKSIGLFQLQEAAAKDAGINPAWRDDPGVNIYGGIRYLKQKLDQSKGNVEQALSRYNRGTPDYRGIGDPSYVQNVQRFLPAKQPGMMARVANVLSPASAEAASPQQAAPSAMWDDIFGAQQPPQATTPTTQPPTPASPQVAPTAPQEPPTPPPDPSATPGMRFQALPSITQLPPAERIQRQQEFDALKPELQQEFLRSEEPVAGGLAVGGGPVAQSQAVTDPAALLAVGRRAPGWREGETPPPGAKRPPMPTEAPLEESLTAPSTMIPLLMPGAGINTIAKPAASVLLKEGVPLALRGKQVLAEGLSQTLGWTAGRTAETGEVPSPKEIGIEAALNIGVGGLVEIPSALRASRNAALRATPGAQILLNQRAVQEAEGLGKRVFNAQDKEVVGKAFDAVRATGEKLDVTPVRDLWNSLTRAEQRIAGNELNKISSTFTDALKTKKLGDWDIGELQHLRSELRIAGASKRAPETQDLLQSLRGSVDEAIHNGMAKGSLPAAELVEAQKAYRKVMQADDLQGLVTRHTKDSPNLKWQELNLAALNKEIRGGGKKSSQRLVAGMDATERQALQQELDSLAKRYPFVKTTRLVGNLTSAGGLVSAIPHVLTGNLPGVALHALPAIANAAMRSPRVMSLFKQSIVDGKGQLAKHHVDALLNAIRHENEGETPAQ